MVFKQVRKDDWEQVRRRIMEEGTAYPECLQLDINMSCNGADYILKIQPDSPRKIVALQVSEVSRSAATERSDVRLVENGSLLYALLELLVYQMAR